MLKATRMTRTAAESEALPIDPGRTFQFTPLPPVRFEQQLLATRQEHVRQAEVEAQAVRRQLVSEGEKAGDCSVKSHFSLGMRPAKVTCNYLTFFSCCRAVRSANGCRSSGTDQVHAAVAPCAHESDTVSSGSLTSRRGHLEVQPLPRRSIGAGATPGCCAAASLTRCFCRRRRHKDVQYGGGISVCDTAAACDLLSAVDPAVLGSLDLQDERAISDVLRWPPHAAVLAVGHFLFESSLFRRQYRFLLNPPPPPRPCQPHRPRPNAPPRA